MVLNMQTTILSNARQATFKVTNAVTVDSGYVNFLSTVKTDRKYSSSEIEP